MPQATARETAGGGTAYIDFLRLDDSATLHIVETKIGHDEMIVLRGLDYWIWPGPTPGCAPPLQRPCD